MPTSRAPFRPSDAVKDSSNKIIVKALKRLKKFQFSKHRLLGPKNYYKNDATTKIDKGLLSEKVHLSEYIAASTFTHCFDGWNFLTRGVESLLNGDIPSCIHFVYYAELRAVMSLMACEGIGIFNKSHIYFDSREIPNSLNNSTHMVAKELIDEWAKLAAKKRSIFQYIKINATNLQTLVDSTGTSSSSAYVSSIVNDWFVNWSLDLKLKEDQKLRNEMSYRPHFDYKQPNNNEVINSIFEIWSGLEPTSSIRFLELDKHLVRIAFEKLFVMTTGKKSNSPSYKKFVQRTIDNIGEAGNNSLLDFMIRKTDSQDHFIIKQAKKARKNNDIIIADPIPMICRAILLLRMSSGSVNNTFDQCYVSSDDLRFWWENLAFGFGITNSTNSGLETQDLFSDVRDSIDSLKDNMIDPSCIKDNFFNFSNDINTIKQFQRTCFWGIGI
ncbi:hypothetical protein HNV11_20540 [Spirosoma taeanense]|uniref:Uncharacterized protein n=1 Tax=Spirosoma taeanense TaxID=2735870 RepID=A0A6M5YBU8_9BACT|nr:hypothetical protein [Spirosoma taeanense]QJW91597.1 hypothetical protein HNV11_20540 [Spirosoma taeanense]